MKKLFFTLCVLCSALSNSAQSDSVYVDLGMNVIRIVNIGMGSQNLNYDVWNPYMLTANACYKRLGLRLGVGYRDNSRTELPTDPNGMTTTESDTSRLDFRVGLGWEVALAPKWSFKFGMDYFRAKEESTFETKFVNENNDAVVTNRQVLMEQKGFSPFGYIQYHISPRVSIGTEILWRFSTYTINDSEISTLTPENAAVKPTESEVVRKYEGNKKGVMAPTALFLNVRF
jgi:opacity protein-like surface antigen